MPASEALLDADSIKRFRSRYREKFGATATQDPLYQALSEDRRMSGMEHWLPLMEERLETLFDHLGENDLVIRDAAADKAIESRREAIDDYYQNRVRAMEGEPGSYRPLEPYTLYLSKKEWQTVERTGRSTSPRRSTNPNPIGSSTSAWIRRAISLLNVRSSRTFTRRPRAHQRPPPQRTQGRPGELHTWRARTATAGFSTITA